MTRKGLEDANGDDRCGCEPISALGLSRSVGKWMPCRCQGCDLKKLNGQSGWTSGLKKITPQGLEDTNGHDRCRFRAKNPGTQGQRLKLRLNSVANFRCCQAALRADQ